MADVSARAFRPMTFGPMGISDWEVSVWDVLAMCTRYLQKCLMNTYDVNKII